MEKYIFEVFSQYNTNVNANMNNIIKELSEEEWDKSFTSYYKSIHELCSHIFISDYTWFNRFCEFCEFNELKHFFNDSNVLNYNWGKIMFKNINEYLEMRGELDKRISVFVNKINGEQLLKIMPIDEKGRVQNMEGTIIEKPLGKYLLHIFNHSTHHRAQISVYLDMLGKENEYSDLWD